MPLERLGSDGATALGTTRKTAAMLGRSEATGVLVTMRIV